ncbi:hypothetical protein [Bordetella genomosp. 1]|nr:hypothetical protein [Bordetella genomosp. 1]
MANPAYKRVMKVVAAAADGSTYRIDKNCSQPPADANSSSYCCLPDGQIVTWEGDEHYKLPDGTIVTRVASRLCNNARWHRLTLMCLAPSSYIPRINSPTMNSTASAPIQAASISQSPRPVLASRRAGINASIHRYKCCIVPPVASTKEEVWIARQIGELLADLSGGFIPTAEAVGRGLTEAAKIIGHGSVSAGAEAIGIPRGSYSAWKRGDTRPPITALLAAAAGAEVELVSIFHGELRTHRDEKYPNLMYHVRHRKPLFTEADAEAMIKAALEETPPPGAYVIADRLHMHERTLTRRYPEYMALLREKGREYRERKRLERMQEALDFIEQTAPKLRAEGKPVTLARLAKLHSGISFPTDAFKFAFEEFSEREEIRARPNT